MIQLLTYQEFKSKADFTDNVSADRFNKYEKMSEETYLRDLIGSELVTKLKNEIYSELLPYVKNCLAHESELYFKQTGNVIGTGIGAIQRNPANAQQAEWVDKQNKIDAIKTILRRYEEQLREVISAGDYTGYNDDVAITKKINFTIHSIGD